MSTFNDRLRQIVTASGLSEAAASKACGLSPSTIRKILAGTSSPTARTIRKLADGLKSTPEWLGFGAGTSGGAESSATEEAEQPLTSIAIRDPSPQKKRIPSSRDTTYIQVSSIILHQYVSGALQNESIPEEQADAYADAVLELIRGRTTAHVVLRLEDELHMPAGFPEPGPDDRSS